MNDEAELRTVMAMATGLVKGDDTCGVADALLRGGREAREDRKGKKMKREKCANLRFRFC